MSVRTTIIGLVVLLVAGGVRGDELYVGTLKYSSVTVTGIDDCQLVYRTPAGVESERLLNTITQLVLVGRDDFNAAEQALADDDTKAAFRAYERARATSDEAWIKELILFRQLLAFQRDHQIDRALELWRRLCKPENGSDNARAMMPGKEAFGEPGSTANAQAIQGLLLDRPKQDETNFDRAVTKLLLDLYTHEGDDEGASREAARLAGQPMTDDGDGAGDASTDGPRSETNLGERLAAATVLMDGVSAAGWTRAVETIEADLHQYPDDMLSEALLVLGLATRKQAGAAEGDEGRRLLLEAGVHFMYVATFFADSDEAAQAMFEAGTINEEIGNARAARKVYAAVLAKYGHLPIAEQATAALEALEKTD